MSRYPIVSNPQCALGNLRLDPLSAITRPRIGRTVVLMRIATQRALDQWWARLFGIEQKELWNRSTVRSHALLEGDSGWFVAWRGRAVHVSVPSETAAMEVESLSAVPFPELTETAFWAAFGHQRGLTLRGPATHAYLDADPGPTDAVILSEEQLTSLRASVTAEEWEEAGWDDEPAHQWGILEGDRVVAAANLSDWDGTPRDVGVLVEPAARGRGLGEVVGQHAASYAIREHGSARWRARITNVPSVRTAQRLGFESWATQLALRP